VIAAWVYHIEDVDLAVQFETLADTWPKLSAEITKCLRSFKRSSDPARDSSRLRPADGALVFVDEHTLTPEERRNRRSVLEKSAHDRATAKLTEGWTTKRMGHFLVFNHATTSTPSASSSRPRPCGSGSTRHFGFVGEGEYVRARRSSGFARTSPSTSASSAGQDWYSESDLEIVTYQDDDGSTSWEFGWVNRLVLRFWIFDKNRTLALGMPGWLSAGLQNLVENLHLKSGKVTFKRDEWNRDDVRQAARDSKTSSAKELLVLAGEAYWHDYLKIQEASQLVDFLAARGAAKDRRTKDLLPEYMRTAGRRREAEKEDPSPKDDEEKPKTEAEEDAWFKKKRQGFKEKSERILQDTFDRTFGTWKESDWKAFEDGVREGRALSALLVRGRCSRRGRAQAPSPAPVQDNPEPEGRPDHQRSEDVARRRRRRAALRGGDGPRAGRPHPGLPSSRRTSSRPAIAPRPPRKRRRTRRPRPLRGPLDVARRCARRRCAKRILARRTELEEMRAHGEWKNRYKEDGKYFRFEYTVPPRIFAPYRDAMEAYFAEFARAWKVQPSRNGFRLPVSFFADEPSFLQIGGVKKGVLGYFDPGPEGPEHLLRAPGSAALAETMFHEANHYLQSLIEPKFWVPHFPGESLAEYYGACRYDPETKKLEVGLLQESRLCHIDADIAGGDLMDLAKLVSTDDLYEHYTWGWSLVHFLMKDPKTAAKFQKFFLALPEAKGVDRKDVSYGMYTIDAKDVFTIFRREFGLKDFDSIRKMEADWHDYVKSKLALVTCSGYEKAGLEAARDDRVIRGAQAPRDGDRQGLEESPRPPDARGPARRRGRDGSRDGRLAARARARSARRARVLPHVAEAAREGRGRGEAPARARARARRERSLREPGDRHGRRGAARARQGPASRRPTRQAEEAGLGARLAALVERRERGAKAIPQLAAGLGRGRIGLDRLPVRPHQRARHVVDRDAQALRARDGPRRLDRRAEGGGLGLGEAEERQLEDVGEDAAPGLAPRGPARDAQRYGRDAERAHPIDSVGEVARDAFDRGAVEQARVEVSGSEAEDRPGRVRQVGDALAREERKPRDAARSGLDGEREIGQALVVERERAAHLLRHARRVHQAEERQPRARGVAERRDQALGIDDRELRALEDGRRRAEREDGDAVARRAAPERRAHVVAGPGGDGQALVEPEELRALAREAAGEIARVDERREEIREPGIDRRRAVEVVAPLPRIEVPRARRVAGLRRALAREREVHVVVRQQRRARARPGLRLVPRRPQDLGRRVPDGDARAEALRELFRLGRGRGVAPELRGRRTSPRASRRTSPCCWPETPIPRIRP
jgi:hypothetical protein